MRFIISLGEIIMKKIKVTTIAIIANTMSVFFWMRK